VKDGTGHIRTIPYLGRQTMLYPDRAGKLIMAPSQIVILLLLCIKFYM